MWFRNELRWSHSAQCLVYEHGDRAILIKMEYSLQNWDGSIPQERVNHFHDISFHELLSGVVLLVWAGAQTSSARRSLDNVGLECRQCRVDLARWELGSVRAGS